MVLDSYNMPNDLTGLVIMDGLRQRPDANSEKDLVGCSIWYLGVEPRVLCAETLVSTTQPLNVWIRQYRVNINLKIITFSSRMSERPRIDNNRNTSCFKLIEIIKHKWSNNECNDGQTNITQRFYWINNTFKYRTLHYIVED